jgi:hypothetical protein
MLLLTLYLPYTNAPEQVPTLLLALHDAPG